MYVPQQIWNFLSTFLILFIQCIVTVITHIYQQMHTIYNIHVLHLQVSALHHHPQGDINIKEYNKLIHLIYIYIVESK
jgi:hypothetical protein